MTAQSASSARSPLLPSTMPTRRSTCEGNAGSGIALRSRGVTIAIASGPLTRITPTALSPIAVAIAMIVSSARGGSGPAGVFGLARRARARGSIHGLLRQDLEHVGDGPVGPGPGGRVEEHEGKKAGQDNNQLRLRGTAQR